MLNLNPSLSTLAIVLGGGFAALNVPGVLNPTGFAATARKFPRNTALGWIFTLLATAWFVHYVTLETVADFANIKTPLCIFFGAVGVATCIFVRDFLAVRGLAVFLLVLAKLTVDTARVVETDWRLVLVTWAYAWVIAGIWLTVSPWRLRDWIGWATATEQRTRWLSTLRLGFGVFVAVLGFTVFR
jgi:hypothetical protein